MRAWIIHETNRGPNGVLTEQKSYEILHLERELKKSLDPKDVGVFHISRFDVVNLSSGPLLTCDGEAVRDLPDLVIARPVVLKDDPQWLPVLMALERANVLCVNAVAPIENTSHKFYMWQTLAANDIPTPASLLLSADIGLDQVTAQFGYPFVLKQIVGTQGTGVALCNNREEFLHAAREFNTRDPAIPLLAQEMIESSRGRDIRALVVEDGVVASMLRQSGNAAEFRSNYSLGGSVTPYQLSKEGQRVAIGATKALGLEYSGVDLLFGKNAGGAEHFVVCEVNHSPGFKGLEEAYPSLNVARLIVDRSLNCASLHMASREGQVVAQSAALEL